MDMCHFVRQQILINYLNSIYLHAHTHTYKSTSHKQLRQNRTIIYLLRTALDIHDKAKLFIYKKKRKPPILPSFFTGLDHGIGSWAVFLLDMKCHTIYSSCYSSTKMSVISKEYGCFYLIKLYNSNEVIFVHQRFPLFFISL